MEANKQILIIGYGNTSRQDDGIAPEFIKRMEEILRKQNISNVQLISNSQLNLEDAHSISEKDIVFFVDASAENIKDIIITKVRPIDSGSGYSLHSVSPGFILQLCHSLYKKKPAVYLVHVKGYEWEIKEGLSNNAKKNLNSAIELILKLIIKPEEINNHIN